MAPSAPALATDAFAQRPARFASASPVASASPTHLDVWQTSLKSAVACEGEGLHSGAMVRMVIKPAQADTGILFIRTDLPQGDGNIRAHHDNVRDVMLSSKIGNAAHSIGTVEHLMAAFALAHIDNAIVEIDGAEVPIMDGSARPFMAMIAQAGVRQLTTPRKIMRILREIRVEGKQGSYCALLPDRETIFEAEIDFESRAIGRQSCVVHLGDSAYGTKISEARTFCMLKDVEAMHSKGLALGGSADNAIIVNDDEVMNIEGLRNPHEFVHHKVLDAIGDLYLLGMPFIGRYRGYKAGHALHHKLRTALAMETDAFEMISLAPTDTPATQKILAAE